MATGGHYGLHTFFPKMFDMYLLPRRRGEEDRFLQVALPVAAFLEMLTKSVNLRATAATRTGCVRHGVGHQTPFSGRGCRNAAEDLRPNILQLNTEGLTADKILEIEDV